MYRCQRLLVALELQLGTKAFGLGLKMEMEMPKRGRLGMELLNREHLWPLWS